MPNSSTFDIIGLGAVTIDDLIYVEAYPPPDAKVPVLRTQRQCGGLTGTALVAASRLGARCAYAGVLGTDSLSRYLSERMEAEGVDMSAVIRRSGVYPIHATIVVDETRHTRNVFVDLSGGSGADPAGPPSEVLLATKVLFVDHIGVPGMLRAAAICRAAGIPIVADFERSPGADFAKLLDLVDHLILSQTFAEKLTGIAAPDEAAKELWTANRETVVVTCGSKGCWYLADGKMCHQPAFEVETVDTTGCGDVFHGAYATGLAEEMSLPERVQFASAAAALKATKPGGQLGIPTRPAVRDFIQRSETHLAQEKK